MGEETLYRIGKAVCSQRGKARVVPSHTRLDSIKLLGGPVFCLGLILVIVGGAELFTGNNLIIMAWSSGKISTFLLLIQIY